MLQHVTAPKFSPVHPNAALGLDTRLWRALLCTLVATASHSRPFYSTWHVSFEPCLTHCQDAIPGRTLLMLLNPPCRCRRSGAPALQLGVEGHQRGVCQHHALCG